VIAVTRKCNTFGGYVWVASGAFVAFDTSDAGFGAGFGRFGVFETYDAGAFGAGAGCPVHFEVVEF